jgi:membrane protease YdiL (CAAX protease family)
MIDHWHFPGWRAIALAVAAGCVTPALAVAVNWLAGHTTGGTLPSVVTMVLSPLWVIAEEWLFRGVVLRQIARVNAGVALVVSSALFAAIHGLPGFPGRVLSGGVFGLLYLRSRSLWPPMVAHFIHNAILFAIVLMVR